MPQVKFQPPSRYLSTLSPMASRSAVSLSAAYSSSISLGSGGVNMSEIAVGIIGIAVLLLLFATGIELGFAMGLVGFLGFAYLNGFNSAINLLATDFYDVITNYGYTIFPLFVLMGQIGFNAGIAVRLYDAANKFIGHVPGGLAMATVIGATGFKTICGSSAATAATFSSVAIPPVGGYGYHTKLSA